MNMSDCGIHPADRPHIVGSLGESAVAALDAWARDENYLLALPPERWEKSGFTDSPLLALFLHAAQEDVQPSTIVVVKACEQEFAHEPSRHKAAWIQQDDFGERHLVGRMLGVRRTAGGGVVMVQQVAGGTLRGMRQMAQLDSPAELREVFSAVCGSLIREWNRGKIVTTPKVNPAAFLRDELRWAWQDGGSLLGWARRSGLPPHQTLRFAGESPQANLPNPLALADGTLRAADGITLPCLNGLTHGDLHTGNILVPKTAASSAKATEFRLVDLTSFDPSAPLTRDPAMLALSVINARHPAEDARDHLIRVLASDAESAPEGDFLGRMAEELRRLYPDAIDTWTLQLLLSVAAAALLHITFDDDRDKRLWFLRLAAHCVNAFLKRTAPDWEPQPGFLVTSAQMGMPEPAEEPEPSPAPPARFPEPSPVPRLRLVVPEPDEPSAVPSTTTPYGDLGYTTFCHELGEDLKGLLRRLHAPPAVRRAEELWWWLAAADRLDDLVPHLLALRRQRLADVLEADRHLGEIVRAGTVERLAGQARDLERLMHEASSAVDGYDLIGRVILPRHLAEEIRTALDQVPALQADERFPFDWRVSFSSLRRDATMHLTRLERLLPVTEQAAQAALPRFSGLVNGAVAAREALEALREAMDHDPPWSP
ncbi:hypothetical protein [Nonomuraea cavernae]|uniref:Uncharacterized protein n=1 Tax=Nonomuraea cavernae TaxID=2045107 RepID=A0A917Z0K9_9ACTN|nr:hypothetical protein [Nonomuraea cavernae]MCA2186292.1 hypothetical protein [Nonomuraea cavernae]GGO69627.1 hypothetical protein GCM10012289_31170 [Nonomuraea cavernae]